MTTIVFGSQTLQSNEGNIVSNVSGIIFSSQGCIFTEGTIVAIKTNFSSSPGLELLIEPSDVNLQITIEGNEI